MLVVAGAGTGKTTVLIQRIARLLREGHARPDEILAVTYTKNAAEEMRNRVRSELHGIDLSGLQLGTFHEYCNHILFRCDRQFGLLDETDLWIYLRRRIRELHLNHFVRAADLGKFLGDLLNFMRRCQDELVGTERYAAYVRQLERGELPVPRVGKSKDAAALSDEEIIARCREIANVFSTVEKMLREDNFGTFGHMITCAWDLLRQDEALLASERAKTRFILVDEFQDANYAQVKILQLLAGEERNVFAVGDPDQAIYQFRGASSAAFALFRQHFPDSKLVALEKNRRSTTAILRTAFAHISRNPDAFPGGQESSAPYRRSPLVSARDEKCLQEGGEPHNRPVEAVISVGKDVEPVDIAAAIRERRKALRCNWNQFAVLYRSHAHRDEVAAELTEQGIPFSIENMDVTDTPEARDLLACLGGVSARDGASLFRVAALPIFAVDPEKLRSSLKSAGRPKLQSVHIADVLAQLEGGPDVLERLEEARREIARTEAKARKAAEIIIRIFQLPASRPLASVLEFIAAWEEKAITKSKHLAEFLEYMEYFREAGGGIPLRSQEEDAVSLMTVHAAKGLEWDHVFVLRASSPSFPCPYHEPLVEFPAELRENDSIGRREGKMIHDQEERRLFYVAMTRARDSLDIHARQGKGKKDPTPPGYVRELLDSPGLRPWFRPREARAFAGELFAQAASPAPLASRSSEWLALPPVSDLSQKLSATGVEIYETCPLQFKLEREWKIPRDVPAALYFGGAMHRVLKTFYDSVRLERPIEEDTLIELLRADLAQAGIEDSYQLELYEKQGIEQLRGFLETARQAPTPHVLHAEEWFEMPIGNATVVGRIDRMDEAAGGRVVITDYKTGKPKSQQDADKSLQLSIYAIAAREKWGYDVDSLVLYNLQENAPVVTRREAVQLAAAKEKVMDVAENIAAGEFHANPDFHCRFCPYRNLCPATEKRLHASSAAPSQRKKRSHKSR